MAVVIANHKNDVACFAPGGQFREINAAYPGSRYLQDVRITPVTLNESRSRIGSRNHLQGPFPCDGRQHSPRAYRAVIAESIDVYGVGGLRRVYKQVDRRAQIYAG